MTAENLPTPYETDGTLLIPGATRVSYELAPDTPFEQWQAILRILRTTEQGLPWWIGDMFVYAASRGKEYEDRAMQVCADLGFAENTVHGFMAVCQRVPKDQRTEALSFSHHKAVAYLEPAVAQQLLSRAVNGGWTVRDLEEAVRELRAKKADVVPPPVMDMEQSSPCGEVAHEPDSVARAAETLRDELQEIGADVIEACDRLRDALNVTDGTMSVKMLYGRCRVAAAEIGALMELLESYEVEAL